MSCDVVQRGSPQGSEDGLGHSSGDETGGKGRVSDVFWRFEL